MARSRDDLEAALQVIRQILLEHEKTAAAAEDGETDKVHGRSRIKAIGRRTIVAQTIVPAAVTVAGR